MTLHYDGLVTISTGRHRRETSWKQQEVRWSDLCTRMSTPVVTNDTYKEYIDTAPDGQAIIKDVGGFVGGVIQGGRRKKDAILTRALLTFDLDYGPVDFMEDLPLLYDNAMFVYSTHKHSPDKPRYRLVIPMDREVMPDQYQAIARKVAQQIGMDWFDPTTFQPERLMYWPSVSRDMQLVTWQQDGPWLKADEILGAYRDWTDLSQWPYHPLENKKIENDRKKQEDPTEKKGIIGAFCRLYTISEVIAKYLSAEYIDTEIEGRYSYVHGSTAMGVVTYDDKYSFSHHATDPASGVLCNAFDLVRIHKFKDKDENVKEGTPANKLPSYMAMLDFCREDKEVIGLIGKERYEESIGDFQVLDTAETGVPEEINLDWLKELEADRKGNYLATIQNICLILKNDAGLKGKIAIDTLKVAGVITGTLPWGEPVKKGYRLWTDDDDSSLRHYLEVIYKIDAVRKIKDALAIIARENAFHPVKDYLDKLEWDGIERLDTLFIDYLGADDTEYVRVVTRKAFTAGVARIYEPGIKYDTILVLVGKQGLRKSTILDKMGGPWFSDSFGNLKTKESAEQLQGVWLMEIGELAGMKKADVEDIKVFVARRFDRYRMPFGLRIAEYARQCVFFGTTNNFSFLIDDENRRFWPVTASKENRTADVFDLTTADIAQLWAEAKYRYFQGEKLYLSDRMEEQAKAAQKVHTEVDDRQESILKYLDTMLPENWATMSIYQRRAWLEPDNDMKEPGAVLRTKVTAAEVWCEVLGGSLKDMSRFNTKPIHNILKALPGWETMPPGKGMRTKDSLYGTQLCYRRIENIFSDI